MSSKTFGVWSGVGLVIADMIGAGVFLSTGFMAQSMRPGLILLAWVVGGVLAMAGARAYAEVARLVPRGGGEYRYLSDLLHPSLGYLAGWASLLVGFSAPVAVDALAAGAFARALAPAMEPKVVGALLIVLLTATHAIGLKVSSRAQNALVGLKILLIVGFVLVGAFAGTLSWPAWTPEGGGDSSLGNFANQLFWIAFAYSGWNAAVYAADDFKEPARDVPRAMVIGCFAVGFVYLALNYIFVANLTPTQGTVVFHYSDFAAGAAGQWDQVTLGQALMAHLLGPAAGKVMSLVTLLIFISAMSAMMLIGPRVYAAMANDGVLPAALRGEDGKPPMAAVVVQGLLALGILYTHDLQSVLSDLGAVLTLFSALTIAGLFKLAFTAKEGARPSAVSLVAAAVYVLSSALILYFGVKNLVGKGQLSVLWWVAGVAAVALVAYGATRALQRRTS